MSADLHHAADILVKIILIIVFKCDLLIIKYVLELYHNTALQKWQTVRTKMNI